MKTIACLALLTLVAHAQDDAITKGIDAFMDGEFAAAFALLEPEARAGDPIAQYLAGYCYRTGYGTKPDRAKGFALAQAAAQKLFPAAWYDVGVCHASGYGTKPDQKAAADWFERAALMGHAPSMTNIGGAFALGRGRPLDLVQGAAWFWLANEAGDKKAAGNFDYCKGKLTAEDRPRVEAAIEALRTQAKAARSRPGDRIDLHLDMESAIAAAFEKGERAYLDKDYETAQKYLLQLAQTGQPDACFYIARMNQRGFGRLVDAPAAVRWYTLAVQRGNLMAMLNLGFMYREGEGVAKDLAVAAALFEAAAWRGIWDAQLEAGVARIRGEGCERSPEWAYVWWTLAARDGNREMARKNLGILQAKDLDATALDRANKLLAEVEQRRKSGEIPPVPKLPAPPG